MCNRSSRWRPIRPSSDRRSFDAGELTGQVLSQFERQLRQRNIALSLRCEPDLAMDSYPGPFGQVLTNLAVNCDDTRVPGRRTRGDPRDYQCLARRGRRRACCAFVCRRRLRHAARCRAAGLRSFLYDAPARWCERSRSAHRPQHRRGSIGRTAPARKQAWCGHGASACSAQDCPRPGRRFLNYCSSIGYMIEWPDGPGPAKTRSDHLRLRRRARRQRAVELPLPV